MYLYCTCTVLVVLYLYCTCTSTNIMYRRFTVLSTVLVQVLVVLVQVSISTVNTTTLYRTTVNLTILGYCEAYCRRIQYFPHALRKSCVFLVLLSPSNSLYVFPNEISIRSRYIVPHIWLLDIKKHKQRNKE